MAMSCFIAPLTFWLYWKGFNLGVPDSTYPAPFAILYREMAVLAVQGSKTLPRHCLQICEPSALPACWTAHIANHIAHAPVKER